jgi:hypothetical protein
VWRDDTGAVVAHSLGNATLSAREEVEALDGGELWHRAVAMDIRGRDQMNLDQLQDALERAADGRNPGPVSSG